MKLIDGKELARSLRGEIAAGVAWLKAEKGVTPGLAVILVGDNPASVSYVTAKKRACAEAGMLSREIRLPAETTEDELVALVKKQHEKAASILMADREKLDELAQYLYQKETITGEEFMRILNS